MYRDENWMRLLWLVVMLTGKTFLYYRVECSRMQIPDKKIICLEVLHSEQNYNSRTIGRRRVVCYDCDEVGHYKSECLQWKTKLCWHWYAGRCKYSMFCPFAHGEHELRGEHERRCSTVRTIR
jgi:hypothetical protein